MKTRPKANNLLEAGSVPKIFVIAVTLSTVLLAACGGGGSGPPAAAPSPTVVLKASSPGELLAYVKRKIKEGAAQGLAAPTPTTTPTSPAPAPVSGAAPVSNASPVEFAGTQLQEQGVDEDDLLKTDGAMLYALSPSRTQVANGVVSVLPATLQAQRRLANGQLAPAGSLLLGDGANPAGDQGVDYSGLFLASATQRIAVLGQHWATRALPLGVPASTLVPIGPVASPRVALELVSLSQPDALSIAQRVRIDGQLVGSRMIGNQLYVVSTWTPHLAPYLPEPNASPVEADAKLSGLRTSDILPTLQINDQPAKPLLADTDCYLQAANAALHVQVTTITAFDMASPTLQHTSRCFVGGGEGLYMSPGNVYLTSSRYDNFAADLASTVFRIDTKTDIHKFALQGSQISYKGSGEVPGHLGWDPAKLSYRMSEYQNDLRVLSFTGQTGWWTVAPAPGVVGGPTPSVTVNTAAPPSPATLTVLRENGSQALEVVGSLPNARNPGPLGHPGEQVYAVKFAGPRAYVVTFRRTDPLYVLDASQPTDIKVLGELAMPGFSDYLYPMGEALLLGVGKDADDAGRVGGVKVALMNVANPAAPRVLQSVVLGQGGSSSALDFSAHGINILQQGSLHRIALPVRVHEGPSGVSGFYQPSYQGLQRFEVDASAQSLVLKSPVPSITFPANDPYGLAYGEYHLGNERSVQIGSMVYYFSGGKFVVANW